MRRKVETELPRNVRTGRTTTPGSIRLRADAYVLRSSLPRGRKTSPAYPAGIANEFEPILQFAGRCVRPGTPLGTRTESRPPAPRPPECHTASSVHHFIQMNDVAVRQHERFENTKCVRASGHVFVDILQICGNVGAWFEAGILVRNKNVIV